MDQSGVITWPNLIRLLRVVSAGTPRRAETPNGGRRQSASSMRVAFEK